MEKMPEYKENYVTLWRNGKWVQVPKDQVEEIIAKDKNGTQDSSKLPAGA